MNSPLTTQPIPNLLTDGFGRAHDVLRLSLTARCNLRCLYCMPDLEQSFPPRREELSLDELEFIAGVVARLGITRIRLTGGEPLLRREVVEIVEIMKNQGGIQDVSLTTNGMLLERHASALARAGLDRINVSLDSLDPDRFARVTQVGDLGRVMCGIEAAHAAGIGPIKINVLALDSFNDDEALRWLELIQDLPLCVRFLEVMPIGAQAIAGLGVASDLTALRELWRRERGLVPAPDAHVGNGPARYWTTPGAEGSVGFITPNSMPYCGSCRRLRLTSQGRLYACLASASNVNLREAIRRRDEGAVAAGFGWSVGEKAAGHRWGEGVLTPNSMFELGG